jgi:hypothetical protein
MRHALAHVSAPGGSARELADFVADERVQVGHAALVNPIEWHAVGGESLSAWSRGMRASRRDLNFIGSTSRPVIMKSPLIIRMVSLVIALPQSSSASLHRRRLRVLKLEPAGTEPRFQAHLAREVGVEKTRATAGSAQRRAWRRRSRD